MDKITVYGIPNCDTTRNAMIWLKKNKIGFSFHDYKQEGITTKKLEDWCNKTDWQNIFNKRSTTWRELPAAEQKKIIDQPSAIKIMIKNNSIIKRPVIEFGNNVVTGFKEEEYKKAFK